MNKISVCLETVLPDVDFYDRIKIAADLGYDGIEFWEVETKDIGRIARLSAQYNMPVVICCTHEVRTIRLNQPSDVFVANIGKSIGILKELGCRSMIALAGDLEGKADSQKNIIIENLKKVADLLVKNDVTLNIEGLNSLVDHKGYYLDSSAVGFEMIKSAGCENIKFLYDIYHMQIMEGNIIENMTRNISLIGHVHAAGVPGRHEPQKGENDYKYIFGALAEAGYTGWFGLEYFPSYDSMQSLRDVRDFLTKSI